MTPGARVQAAIEVLDAILEGAPAERALTQWARSSRFAGSKDRAAVRDHVYDALRKRRSAAACGGGLTGRGLMIGLLRLAGEDPAPLFDGSRHAPLPLAAGEEGLAPDALTVEDAADLPDWLRDRFVADLGPEADAAIEALRERAPVFVRVNLSRTTRAEASAALAEEGIATEAHPDVPTALRIVEGARKLRGASAYASGLVELQDASSQAAVAELPMAAGASVLDFCAGGGGKALAFAARGAGRVLAHDIDARRMSDLPARAARAGAKIELSTDIAPDRDGLFDIVFVDAPCSGSGTWRRDPDAKWRLTPEALERLVTLQSGILERAASFVRPGGSLAYATCSILSVENAGVVDGFLSGRTGVTRGPRRRWLPSDAGDGFHLSITIRDD